MNYVGLALLDGNGIVQGKAIFVDGFPNWTESVPNALSLSRFILQTLNLGSLQSCTINFKDHKIIAYRRQSKLYAAILINGSDYEVEKREIRWLKEVPLNDLRRLCLYHDIVG